MKEGPRNPSIKRKRAKKSCTQFAKMSGESMDSNLNDDGGSSYTSGGPVNSDTSVTSPSILHTAASRSTPLPPTHEEMEGWRALIRYIKDGKQVELLKVAIEAGNEQLVTDTTFVTEAKAHADLVKSQLEQACDASEAALATQDDAGLRASVQHLIQMVRVDAGWRAYVEQTTANYQATKLSIEVTENTRDFHLEKQNAEAILKKTESLGVFSHGDSLYLTKQLRKILRDPSFINIKTIAFISSWSDPDEQYIEGRMSNISAEVEKGGRLFVVRAPVSPPTSPTPPSPSPSPPHN